MVDAGEENFLLSISRTQQNAFLDAFSKNFVFVPHIFFVQQKRGVTMAHLASLGCISPVC